MSSASSACNYAFDLGQPGIAEPFYHESVERGRERMRLFPESNMVIFDFIMVQSPPGLQST